MRKLDLQVRLILALLLSLCALGGCGGDSGSSGTSPTPAPTPVAGIDGFVFGGSATAGSPIGGALITLYQTGASGYGTGAFQLAQATSESNGRFVIPAFTCQTIGYSQQLYLVATGGTPKGQSSANSAIGLSAGVGSCGSFARSVVINEVTTIAIVWTLDQFMDPSGLTIGTSSTNQTGLTNAAASITATTLVDTSTGLAPKTVPDGVISPTASLYSVADILSNCVDSSGAGSTECQNLFVAATPTLGGEPTTTLQAALDIARNPLNNVGALFAQMPAKPPFTPALTVAPVSWVLSLKYAPVNARISSPYSVALDGAGNVWVANGSGNSVSELTGASGFTTGFNFAPGGASLDFPSWVAIDTANNVWVANLNSDSVSELTGASDYATGFNFAPSGATLDLPTSIALDTAGNLWLSNFGNDSVSELESGCSSSSCTGDNFNNSNTGAPGAEFSNPASLLPDSAGNLWVANYGSDSVSKLESGCSGASCTGDNFNNSNTGTPGALFAGPIQIVVDITGNAWTANLNNNSVSILPAACITSNCTAANYNNGNTGTPGARLNTPNAIAIDAANNVWTSNTGNTSVSELTATSAYTLGFNFGPWPTFLAQFAVATDAAGNLWIANNYDDSVSEMIGVTRPTLTPLQACLELGQNVCLP